MPKVSCIMPVYNTVDYLEECIESILNQSFTDFEFIISDDGSTDWSKEIIRKYTEQDKRIIFLDNKKNRWICANLNDMVNLASWEYIAIMESDDISYKERFKVQLNEFSKDITLDLIWTQWKHNNQNWDIILENYPDMNYDFSAFKDRYLFKYTFVSPSVIFKKNIINKIGLFQYDWLWDFYFYSRILFNKKYNFKCINIKNILGEKRVHTNSLWRSKFLQIEKLYLHIRIQLIKKYELKNLQSNLILKSYISFIKWISLWLIIKFTSFLWIYNILSKYYRKYILNRI